MAYLKPFHDGWVSEYIADHVLSRFCYNSGPLKGGDDFGIDRICTIYEELTLDGKTYLSPRNSFLIQIKSKGSTQIDLSKIAEYLSLSEMPYFIGIVDRESLILSVYSGIFLPPFFAFKGVPKRLTAELCYLPRLDDPEGYLEQVTEDEFIVRFPKIADIPAVISDEELEKVVGSIKTDCTHMQYNTASTKLHRYMLEGYPPYPIFLFAGIDSIRNVEPNFIQQLTEVLFNLQRAYDSEGNEDLAKRRFKLYEKVYDLVLQEYSSLFPQDTKLLTTVYKNAKAVIDG